MQNLQEQIIEELIFENIEKLNDPKTIEEIDKTISDMVKINKYWIFENLFQWIIFKTLYMNFKDIKHSTENEDEKQLLDEIFSKNIFDKIMNIFEEKNIEFIK